MLCVGRGGNRLSGSSASASLLDSSHIGFTSRLARRASMVADGDGLEMALALLVAAHEHVVLRLKRAFLSALSALFARFFHTPQHLFCLF